MFYYEDIESTIFHLHEILPEKPDELIVMSGYLGPSPVEKLKELPFKVTVIGGMYFNGISSKLYDSLKKATDQSDNISLNFSKEEIHSKIYIWKKGDKVLSALIGSANFSSKGLRSDRRESLALANRATFQGMSTYIDSIYKESIIDPKIIRNFKDQKKFSISTKGENEITQNIQCNLPLYKEQDGKKMVPLKSHLNWSLSSGHTAIGDAYIAIPIDFVKMYPLMFKPFDPLYKNENHNKKRRSNPIELIWDDGTTMEASLEGGGDYPKQLTSYSLKSPVIDGKKISVKSILGRYLRNRLGVGLHDLIVYDDLIKYGRDTVTLTLLEEGIYYCDFSVDS